MCGCNNKHNTWEKELTAEALINETFFTSKDSSFKQIYVSLKILNCMTFVWMPVSEWNGWLSEKEKQILPWKWNSEWVSEWVRRLSGLLSTGISNKWKKGTKGILKNAFGKKKLLRLLWEVKLEMATYTQGGILTWGLLSVSLQFPSPPLTPFVWLMCM